jgi:hypothetical protein
LWTTGDVLRMSSMEDQIRDAVSFMRHISSI